MTVLRKYSVQEVGGLGEALLGEIDAGVISEALLEHYLEIFKFRDAEGRYWTYAPREGAWSAPGAEEQARAQAPDGPLEGPDSLSELSSGTVSAHGPAQPVEGEPSPESGDPVAGFQARMHGIRAAYQAGEINSAAAEQLSGQLFLVDQEAKFWTVGFRSGYWYQRGDGRWIFSRQEPASDSLLDTETGEMDEALEDAYLEFVMNEGDPLPEPVADEWSPPEGLAEAVFLCPVCGRADLGLVEQCRFCGTSLTVQTSEAAPAAPRFCGHCGAPVEGPIQFCTQCGEKL